MSTMDKPRSNLGGLTQKVFRCYTQGSEKWIGQIAALLDKMPSFGKINFLKMRLNPSNTYYLDDVQKCFVQVSDD